MNDFKIKETNNINSGFKIPEGYFEDLSDKVALKINKPEQKLLSLFYRKRVRILFIAALLIISLSISVLTKLNVKSNDEKLTLENYITNQSDISQYDLIALLEAEDIEKIKFDLKLDTKNIEEVLTNSGEIENYLTE